VCGSSPLLPELEETACPHPTEFNPQIFSFAETVSTSSSNHGASHSSHSYSTDDDAFIIGAFGDVLFGDETDESFADFTALFADEVGAHGKDEEEAGGQSAHVHVVEPAKPDHIHDLYHDGQSPMAIVTEDADLQAQGGAAAVPDDAALIDQFVAEFLDPCFADHVHNNNQPKAFAPPSLPARAPTTVRGGGGRGAAEEEPKPLKTTRRGPPPPRLSFGRRGGGGGLAVPTVPVAPSVPSVPQPSNSSFSSFLSIPAPAVPTVDAKASTFGFGTARPPMPMTFAIGLGPSDFKTKREYRRVVAIPRYLAKRKRRQWNKEPTYATRTTAAHRRPRSNGKFSRSEAFVSASELKK